MDPRNEPDGKPNVVSMKAFCEEEKGQDFQQFLFMKKSPGWSPRATESFSAMHNYSLIEKRALQYSHLQENAFIQKKKQNKKKHYFLFVDYYLSFFDTLSGVKIKLLYLCPGYLTWKQIGLENSLP